MVPVVSDCHPKYAQAEREAAVEAAIQQLRPQIEQEMLEKVLQNIGDEEVRGFFCSKGTDSLVGVLSFAGISASQLLLPSSFGTELQQSAERQAAAVYNFHIASR